ncbi:MAG: PEP-CTERM sorting domain-containing protein [Planctomycetaceae bacterium]|nr:PEP-CTERM sorting domain-containing protein [Planctomycetaceae bacterium]MCP4477689.1 PEP-CTERM sorting domain-containing protein [Planctomycetaceae bacterium]
MKKLLPLTICFLTALSMQTVHADIIVSIDSADFTYLYEMDVNPDGQDLDSNSTNDFFSGNAGGLISPQTYSGGFASSNQSASPQEILFRTDFGGSITRNTLSNANSPWTIETRVRKDASTSQGADGWFGIALQNPGSSQSVRVNFEDDRISMRNSGANTDYLTGTNFADSNFHTLRIAYEGNNSYFVWADDQLLNIDVTTASGFGGGNGSFNAGGAWFIGDFSGGLAGDWDVDYIRYTNSGAFSPVPEPTSFVLFTGAIAAAGLRRRRR